MDIEKRLGRFHLQVCLEAGSEVLALLGPSGCGKSLTLRCIAGMERPDRGRIEVDGVPLFDAARRVCLPPQQRRAGLLFQSYALFPHMTVRQNVAAGAHRIPGRAARAAQVDELLARFSLADVAELRPAQLSGGQQQRAALARLLISRPRILLLDEPFSALDRHLRLRLERELRQVLRQFDGTVLLVSHDRDEVYRLADRVAVLDGGVVEACGDKRDVFARPATRRAAVLTGCENLSRLTPVDARHVRAADWGVVLETAADPADAAWAGTRAREIAAGPGPNAVVCDVVEAVENPFSYTVFLRPAGADATLSWTLDKAAWQRLRAARVQVSLPPPSLILLRR